MVAEGSYPKINTVIVAVLILSVFASIVRTEDRELQALRLLDAMIQLSDLKRAGKITKEDREIYIQFSSPKTK